MDILLKAGARIHVTADGSSPLHMAVCVGLHASKAEAAATIVELLLNAGADPFDRCDSGPWPLQMGAPGGVIPVYISGACTCSGCTHVSLTLAEPSVPENFPIPLC